MGVNCRYLLQGIFPTQIEPWSLTSPALAGRFFTTSTTWELSIFPNLMVFSNESALCIRWPKYWSFSISPSNEYSGLISFRSDWFDLLAAQRTFKSLLQQQLKNISSLVLSLLCGSALTSIPDDWKNHSFDSLDFCQQSDISSCKKNIYNFTFSYAFGCWVFVAGQAFLCLWQVVAALLGSSGLQQLRLSGPGAQAQ